MRAEKGFPRPISPCSLSLSWVHPLARASRDREEEGSATHRRFLLPLFTVYSDSGGYRREERIARAHRGPTDEREREREHSGVEGGVVRSWRDRRGFAHAKQVECLCLILVITRGVICMRNRVVCMPARTRDSSGFVYTGKYKIYAHARGSPRMMNNLIRTAMRRNCGFARAALLVAWPRPEADLPLSRIELIHRQFRNVPINQYTIATY